MKPKRPKVVLIHEPTLFELDKLEATGKLAINLKVDRPYSAPSLMLGTSAFTASGWEGSFYPPGMKSRDFLSYYATQFKTVEIDSTFYGTPSPMTVAGWHERTPQDFTFAVKVPHVRFLKNRCRGRQATRTLTPPPGAPPSTATPPPASRTGSQ